MKLIRKVILGMALLVALFALPSRASTLQGFQGGTGIATSTSGNNGKCLTQSSSTPFLMWMINPCYNASTTIATNLPITGGAKLTDGDTITLGFTNPGFVTAASSVIWSAIQTFLGGINFNSTATFNSSTILTGITNAFLATDGSGKIIATSTPSGGSGSVSTSSAISINNFPFWVTATGGLSGTSTLTVSGANLFAGGTFNASGTITQNGIAVSTATNTISLTSSSTYTLWIDGNRSDAYVANGSILNPYKTFSAALAAVSGIPSYALFISPATYVEGAPLSFPSGTFQLIGNEAVLVVPSGVSFNGPHDIYDLTISGNVVENDTSTTNVHQFNNGVITGNFTANGLTTFSGMTLPTRGTVLTVATGSNFTAVNNYFANSFVVSAGMANLDGIGIFASTTNAAIKVNAGGQLTMNGGTVFNYGGPGIDVSASGATSTPNEISNVSVVVLATSTTSTVYCGTSQCLLSDLATLSDLSGGFHAPSGTAWTTSYNEDKVIFNSFSVGTSSTPDAQTTLSTNISLPLLAANSLLATNGTRIIITTTTPATNPGTLSTTTANTAGQIAIGNGGNTLLFNSSFTATTSTGVLAAPTGTFSGTLSVSTTTISTSSALFVNGTTTFGVGTATLVFFGNVGHWDATGTIPTISSCGTSPTSTGSDYRGRITVGSVAATSCTLTFVNAFVNKPSCVYSEETESVVNALSMVPSTTTLVFSQTGLTSNILDYDCVAQGE